jgi:predicted Zn-dependent protease
MKYRTRVAAVSLLTLTGVGGLVSTPSPHAQQAGAPLLSIMQSELQRNFGLLSKEQTPAYYIGYTVHDVRVSQIVASFGAVEHTEDSRQRFASVDVRVGDYALDNTHPIRGEGGGGGGGGNRGGGVTIPLSDDAKPIQLALWQATDRAYKSSTEALIRVRTNVASKIQDEIAASDFSREDPQVHAGQPVSYTIDERAWEARLRRISALFADDPLLFDGSVSLTVRAGNRYLTNSEGSRIATGDLQYRLFIQAATKAADGMELPLYRSYFSRTPDGLPDEKQLLSDTRDMMTMLANLRQAPLVEPYSGPAILSGRAAGVFFHEIFGHRVEGSRQRNADDGQTFGGRLNELVLPSFLSVVFDPTIRARANTELMGYYEYDDEGVRAQRVSVVDQGMLKTFLMGRSPLRALARSNGHGRGEPGRVPVSRQSNLIVEASRAVPSATLVQMLKDEAKRQGKPFGLLFDEIEGGFTITGRDNPNAFNVMPHVVYRIYTDDRAPELVRGVDLIGTPITAFGKIVAASDKIEVFNGMCGAESGRVPVSASAPELLVSEVEVQKKSQSQETMPILPAPPRTSRSGRTF